jgi:hypothetical protein
MPDAGAEQLAKDSAAVAFVADAFAHLKVMATRLGPRSC